VVDSIERSYVGLNWRIGQCSVDRGYYDDDESPGFSWVTPNFLNHNINQFYYKKNIT